MLTNESADFESISFKDVVDGKDHKDIHDGVY